MWTGLVHKSDPTFGVPEGHQILAQQANALGLPVLQQILRRQKWNPIEPEQFSKRRALANPHQPFIVFVREHERPPSILPFVAKRYLAELSSRATTRSDNPRSRAVQSGSDAASGCRGMGGSLPVSTRLTIISTRRRSSSFSTSSTTNPSAVQPGSSG